MSLTPPVVTTRGLWSPPRPDLCGLAPVAISGSVVGVSSPKVCMVIGLLVKALNEDHKVLWCGNGGSAAQADHLSAELSGRFKFDHPALASVSLVGSPATLTAVANDYGYEHVFTRQVEALGRRGDVLVALSTSGESPNVLGALAVARRMGMGTVLLTGDVDLSFVDADEVIRARGCMDTAEVQERHLALGHEICGAVEQILFGGR